MYSHRQQQSSGVVPKIQLLQSNTNRVLNQHETLCKLIEDGNTTGKIKYHISLVEDTTKRIDKLKQNMMKIVSPQQLYKNKLTQNEEAMLKDEVRDLQNQMHKIRQQIGKRKKQQILFSKNSIAEVQRNIYEIKRRNQAEIGKLRKNINKYLSNARQQIAVKNEAKILESVNGSLLQDTEQECLDIQAQIGLLLCQLEYQDSLSAKRQLYDKITFIENKYKKEEQKQLEMGKFERQIASKKMIQFYIQTTKRIAYDCQLLFKNIQASIQCLKANLRSKHKSSGIYNKYEQNMKYYIKKIDLISHEIAGMKMKIVHSRNKIRILDMKIRELNTCYGESFSEKELEFNYQQVQSNIFLCRSKFQEFQKLKIQYLLQ